MDTITTVTCVDCTLAIANDDYSGMSDILERAIREAIYQVTIVEGYHVAIDPDVMHDFSSQRCGVCDNTLAGVRFGATLYPNEG